MSNDSEIAGIFAPRFRALTLEILAQILYRLAKDNPSNYEKKLVKDAEQLVGEMQPWKQRQLNRGRLSS